MDRREFWLKMDELHEQMEGIKMIHAPMELLHIRLVFEGFTMAFCLFAFSTGLPFWYLLAMWVLWCCFVWYPTTRPYFVSSRTCNAVYDLKMRTHRCMSLVMELRCSDRERSGQKLVALSDAISALSEFDAEVQRIGINCVPKRKHINQSIQCIEALLAEIDDDSA